MTADPLEAHASGCELDPQHHVAGVVHTGDFLAGDDATGGALVDPGAVDELARAGDPFSVETYLALRTGASLIVATTHREGDRLVVSSSELADPETFRAAPDPVRALTEWWSRELDRRIRAGDLHHPDPEH